MSRFLSGVVVVAFCSTAQAGNVAAYGMGNEVCSLTLSNQPAYRDAIQHWLGGFVTGVNAALQATYQRPADNITMGTPIDVLYGWVRDYCRQNPAQTIGQAAQVVIFDYAHRVQDEQKKR